MTADATVFVVDDDDGFRESLSRLLESAGLRVEAFTAAEAFLNSDAVGRPGCLLLDVRMPGMDGLELQERLAAEGIRLPVLILSAHGDVEQAVRAMKTGAVDFLRKPYDAQQLLARIRAALEADAVRRREERKQALVAARVASLTPRERDVLDHLVAGKNAKQIALELNLSSKTVDVHRGHILNKMRTDSLVELALLVRMLRESD